MFRRAYFIGLALFLSPILVAAQEPVVPDSLQPTDAAHQPSPTNTPSDSALAVPPNNSVPAPTSGDQPADVSPAFTVVPELKNGFDLLYMQKFEEGRQVFQDWASRNPNQPFGQIAIAASYLFEELYRQGVLTSDFFLNEKKFLRGIDGKPDPGRMSHFHEAVAQARQLARERQRTNPSDGEALFSLTLAAGMESDALTILEKRHMDGLKRMKEANDYARQLLAQHPDTTDAYLAPGIANYVIGSLGAGVRFALWFGGIHGDKKLGMQQVSKTVESGRYFQPFGKIMLALAARREKQNVLAQRLLRELNEQFPGNELFSSEYAKAMGQPIPAALSR